MNIKIGDIVLVEKDNPYHIWVMDNIAVKKKYTRRTIEVDAKYKAVKELKYGTIFMKKEMITLILDKTCKNINGELLKLNRRGRITLIEVENRKQVKEIQLLNKVLDKNEVHKLPSTKEYTKKVEILDNIITGWKVKFENGDVRKLLISLMIRDTTSWNTINDLALLYSKSNKKITMEVLEDIYPDDDFYNLSEYLLAVLKGKLKWKNFKKTDYYLETKGYSEAWLANKLVEETLNLSLMYRAYRAGVINMPLTKSMLKERISFSGANHLGKLLDFSYMEQKHYLAYVREVPYNLFKKIEEYVYAMPKYPTKTDYYLVLMGIKEVMFTYWKDNTEVFKR